ncbi:MAG: hypothetical protein HN904_06850 [Victivallales bacterium]|nr:hypothetical protein [Victivallales bacterium]
MRTVYPTGTTLYKPDACFGGYTIIFGGLSVKLVDMNGRIANQWRLDTSVHSHGTDRTHLLKNGHILVSRGGMTSTDGMVEEYDWGGNLVWQYFPEGTNPHHRLMGPHHDVWRKENGNTLLICREAAPEEYLKQVHNPLWQNQTICGDTILEVNPAGELVWEWNSHGHLDINHYRLVASPGWHAGPDNSTVVDWTHVNTVRELPENQWFDQGDQRFKPGNVMISPRQLDTVYIIDRDSGDIVWEYSGDYFGGLSGQHEPYMIPKGCPGAGNVMIFDNGASPWKDLGHAGMSYVLEVSPMTKELVWVYNDGLRFHSTYTSSAQRLPNGNTLICEAAARRVFEVTPECKTVWEYVGCGCRSYRYGYDYCPQTAALGLPNEVSVTPPKDLRIPPDAPLD